MPTERRQRYRPLPTGSHGLDPELVKRDQRERLQQAIVELIAEKGYRAVRIADLAKLARVSQPTFYSLYADKEALLVSAYDDIATRTARTVIDAYASDGSHGRRLQAALRAFAELACAEPEAMSLELVGAFGAGPKTLARRRHMLQTLEGRIFETREAAVAARTKDATHNAAAPHSEDDHNCDLTVKFILGGLREVAATRLCLRREQELPGLAGELAAWASAYPRALPPGLAAPAPQRSRGAALTASERARRAGGRLPSGRSELPREVIVSSQRERIVDATAAIVAEKGLAGLTVPQIAKRANVSLETFYNNYSSKHEAFLGAQKIGLHQALRVTVAAYATHEDDWPRAVAAGLHALIAFLASEPVHAHLTLVDTFAASPEAIAIRASGLEAFAAYLKPGYERTAGEGREVPGIAGEAVAGGVWQVLHHYIERGGVEQLPDVAPQLVHLALTPFIGPELAASTARASLSGA